MSNPKQTGYIMPTLLSFLVAIIIIGAAVLNIILNNLWQVGNTIDSQKAFNIAEAGVNYYLWHLSHNPSDFRDGQSTPVNPDATLGYGPYQHNYIDDNAVNQGTYTIWVKPKSTGSTIATIRSIGKVKNSNAIRTVEANIGAASFASYGVVSDSALWFGNTETADGPVHSNQGVRMDGASTGDVTSPNSTYVPPSNLGGDGNNHPGVWCYSGVVSPVNCNTRSKSDWRYPVPSVDFNQITSSLCTMKKTAFASDGSTAALATQATACSQTPTNRTNAYLPQRATNGSYSLTRGYLILLNTDGTYDLYQVNGENDQATPYTNALTRSLIATNISVPASGVIFAEDNVWVLTNPTYHGRVSIAAGRLATSNNANIVISDDIKYSTKDGSDAIGLIAEDSIIVAPYAPPASGAFTFEIDGALLAQSGNVSYPGYYRTNSSRCTRGWVNANQTMLFYGSVATRQTWTWTWLFGGGSCGDAVFSSGQGYVGGVLTNTTQFDYNLQYAPPPSFPVTTGYNILSWREVLTKP